MTTNSVGAGLHSRPVSEALLQILQKGDILLGDGITPPTRQYLNRALSKRGLKFHLAEMHPVLDGYGGRICQLEGCLSKRSNRSYLVTRNSVKKSIVYFKAIRESEPNINKARMIEEIRNIKIFAFEN